MRKARKGSEYKAMGHVKRTQGPPTRASKGQSQNNLSNKTSNVILCYDPKYKKNMHKSILIPMTG